MKADLGDHRVRAWHRLPADTPLEVGAAWRVVDVNTDFSTAKMGLTNGVPVLRNIHFEGMSDTRYDGVRLGVQCRAPDDRWGFGAVWRNEVAFEARGKTSGVFQAPVGGIQTLPGGTASIKNVLPQQFSLGFYYRETPELTTPGGVLLDRVFGQPSPGCHRQSWTDLARHQRRYHAELV